MPAGGRERGELPLPIMSLLDQAVGQGLIVFGAQEFVLESLGGPSAKRAWKMGAKVPRTMVTRHADFVALQISGDGRFSQCVLQMREARLGAVVTVRGLPLDLDVGDGV